MDKKAKKKLDGYNNYTYGELVREAVKAKGNLKRKQDFLILKKAEERADALFDNKDPFFQREATKSLCKFLSIPYLDILNEKIDNEAASIVPKEVSKANEMLPFAKKGNKLSIAVANPLSIDTIEKLPYINGYIPQFVLSSRQDIGKVISGEANVHDDKNSNKAESVQNGESTATGSEVKKTEPLLSSQVTTINNSSPVAVIDTILKKAMEIRATDIHFESDTKDMRVRLRVDGMLLDYFRIPEHLIGATVSRVKVLSSLDITEVRLPQDGRMSLKIGETDYHLRIATLPTKMGENIVCRIIQQGNIFNGFEKLGLDQGEKKTFKSIISRPHGMALITGPIGSGKTTSIYTALNELDTSKNKVVTIEDPVECLISGISQVEVDPKIDFNFVNSLRSVLRQDADILMVGEIRDNETAKIAVRAALTGQLLFSTLHAVDTASAVTTLRNFDVPPFLIASALNGIIAQRLVRKICEHCKEVYSPATRLLEQIGLKESDWDVELAYGKGCEKCSGLGFRGRTAIFEILKITDTIKDAIINEVKENELRELSIKEGLKTLHEIGLKKVTDKVTTPEEVMREIILKGGKL